MSWMPGGSVIQEFRGSMGSRSNTTRNVPGRTLGISDRLITPSSSQSNVTISSFTSDLPTSTNLSSGGHSSVYPTSQSFEVCWLHIKSIISSTSATAHDADAVNQFSNEMLKHLAIGADSETDCVDPTLLEVFFKEAVLDRIHTWAVGTKYSVVIERITLQHLGMYDYLIGRSHQSLLRRKLFIQPLFFFLTSCTSMRKPEIEEKLVLVLNQVITKTCYHSLLSVQNFIY